MRETRGVRVSRRGRWGIVVLVRAEVAWPRALVVARGLAGALVALLEGVAAGAAAAAVTEEAAAEEAVEEAVVVVVRWKRFVWVFWIGIFYMVGFGRA